MMPLSLRQGRVGKGNDRIPRGIEFELPWVNLLVPSSQRSEIVLGCHHHNSHFLNHYLDRMIPMPIVNTIEVMGTSLIDAY